ncbi:MAG: dCTP deaminase [Chlamydiae bacterium]|nr:dCTP deaminase [Chlamydiota bacterium]MBI3265958.1 dCTP deaminase [Chlamydiota bacterium]
MPIKSDRWIKKMSLEEEMISPFEEKQVRNDVISFGLSSYGYDIRISNQFKIFQRSEKETFIDPKNSSHLNWKDHEGNDCIVPPHNFVLARTVERFKIPRRILTLCVGKSTYARCGILVNVTPFEPEWEGYPTLQISNITNIPVKLYANEGIAQVIFFESDENCLISYADKKGKYQDQKQEITLPRI